ncbi:helix-turn-helix domain-containing protein [Noviherbaspirillum sp. Root189]|uniref:helix-turn-helix domain-containing protein n=1 Tax=Noviherbaspirillum sp. Root189 TaxID=1736487 RepID=UPI00070CBEEB|nr:helix-turn-helix domain-containing protein [Noviherbaspirillum sp. Root189]KRB90469.1 hypothetical protein ASE07_16890 [Noviherbaspirillum sp. Root189]
MSPHGAEQPSSVQEFLFGDALLHTRFSMAIDVLARLVMAHPRSMTAAALAEASGQTARSVRTLLGTMQVCGLVYPDDKIKDAWSCPAAPGRVTLADVFRSVSIARPDAATTKKTEGPKDSSDDTHSPARAGVDLLLMQATMAINQVVFQHLQSFDLGKLKAVSTGGSFQMLKSKSRDYIPEPL